MGYIYLITNDITNKNYIGQTSRTITERWADHLSDYKYLKYKNHLYNSMRKYGVEHFHISEIEQVENEQLNEREIYWIKYYDSYNNGYNDTLGGEGRVGIDREIVPVNWNSHLDWTVEDMAKFIGCSDGRMSRILTELGVSHEERAKRSALKRRQVNGQTLMQYDLDGNFIAMYNSSKDAEEQTGAQQDEINRCCTRSRNAYSANGFIWKRKDDDTPINIWVEANKRKLGKKSVEQYSLEGNLIQTYSCIRDAKKAIGVKLNSGQISSCCNKHNKSAYGYIWKFADDPTPIEELVKIQNPKMATFHQVEQYDLNGNLINIFPSIRAAAREYSPTQNSTCISEACNGKQKTAYGYVWKFKENIL